MYCVSVCVPVCVVCVCPCTDSSPRSHLGVKQAVLWAGHQHKNVHLHKVGHLGWVDLANGNSVGLGRCVAEAGRFAGRGAQGEGHRERGTGRGVKGVGHTHV